uniref:Myb/SANT-like domain-containing protein n=1 Tax=Kalanchoe fedtschenkoi TaxID=63787 RepID=A0A7N0U352_KALFE
MVYSVVAITKVRNMFILQMETEVTHQSKQERSRTRWTPSLDKIFADLVVEQIRLGNRPNNVFDKKTWNQIRDRFNSQTDLNFNNNQLRKHLDVLRTRYHNLKSTFDQPDFSVDVSFGIGLELWDDIGAQPKHEAIRVKDSPIYEQLCTIFSDSGCDGKYARSSHYEELDKSIGAVGGPISSNPDSGTPHSETPSSNCVEGVPSLSENAKKNTADRKRKCPFDGQPMPLQSGMEQETKKNTADRKKKCPFEGQTVSVQSGMEQETKNAIASALLDMVAASKVNVASTTMQGDNRFSISKCIKELDEMQHVDDQLYYAALDLFEDPSLREIFISLKGDAIRLTWLQGKCCYSFI